MLNWYGQTSRRYYLIVLLLLFLGSITAIRFGVRERVELQPPEIELRFRLPNGESQVIRSRWPSEYELPSVEPPENKVFVNWYLDPSFTTRFETNVTPLSNRTFYPRFDAIRDEVRFIDVYGVTYGRSIGDVGSTYAIPTPPEYYGLRFVGYDVDLPEFIPPLGLVVQALYEPIVQLITLRFGDTEIEVEYGFNQVFTTQALPPLDPIEGQELIGYLILYEEEETFVPLDEPEVIPNGASITPVYEPTTYRIRFFGEDISIRSLSRTMDQLIGRLPRPQRDGFQFEGWYVDDVFSSLFDLVVMPARNVNLFAKWLSVPLASADEELSAPAPTPTPPPSNDDPVVTTYLYEFIDSGVVIASGMLAEGATIPTVNPAGFSGYRFDGWSPTPSTMPASNIQFVAQYTEVFILTIVYNDPVNTVDVVEVAPGDPIPLNQLETTSTSMYLSTVEDDSLLQTLSLMSSSSSFIPLTNPTPAIEAFIKDPTLRTDDSSLIVTSGTTMPSDDLIIYARWNFEIEVQIVDPFEPNIVLASGMFRPGQQITISDFTNVTNTSGYATLTLPANYRAPRVLPSSGVQPTEPQKEFDSFVFNLDIGSGVLFGESGVVPINRNRFDMLDLPTPVLFGYSFQGYYEQSDLSGSAIGDFRLDFATISQMTFPVTYYAKWEAIPPQEQTLQFYDENNVVISSGKFFGGSGLESVNQTLPTIADFVGEWKHSGLQLYGIPAQMPFEDLDLIPYYELSSDKAQQIIQEAIDANAFSGLQILSGQTDTQVVEAKLFELTSGLSGRDSNLTLTAVRVGNLDNTGTNTYTISLVSELGQTLSMTITVEFFYSDEFVSELVTTEVLDYFDSNTTGQGFSDTSSTTPLGEPFRFQNNNDICVTKNLEKVLLQINFTFTSSNGVLINISNPFNIVSSGTPRRADFTLTIQVSTNDNTPVLTTVTRRVYWVTGGTPTFPNTC